MRQADNIPALEFAAAAILTSVIVVLLTVILSHYFIRIDYSVKTISSKPKVEHKIEKPDWDCSYTKDTHNLLKIKQDGYK